MYSPSGSPAVLASASQNEQKHSRSVDQMAAGCVDKGPESCSGS